MELSKLFLCTNPVLPRLIVVLIHIKICQPIIKLPAGQNKSGRADGNTHRHRKKVMSLSSSQLPA